MKIVRAILFVGHKFRIRGSDHMEGLDHFLKKELGHGVAHLYNKRGGIMYVLFPGDLNDKETEELIDKVAQLCDFEYVESVVEQYSAEYEKNLKSWFGDKIIVSECL